MDRKDRATVRPPPGPRLTGARTEPMRNDNTLWGHGRGFKDTEFEVERDGHVRMTGSRYDISGFSMPGASVES